MLLPLLSGGFVNLAARWQVGPLSGMGLQTAVLAGVVLAAAFLAGRYPSALLLRLAPLALLLLWAGLRSIVTPPTFEGAQNALVYLLFAGSALLSGTVAARDPEAMGARLGRAILWLQVIVLAVAADNLLRLGVPRGGNWSVGPRSLSLVCLIPLNWHLARWAHGTTASLAAAALCFAVIVSTTSRTASAIALLSMAVVVALQARRRPARAASGLAALAVGLGLVALLVAVAPPFHARLFAGDTSLRVGEYGINMTGRAAFWRVMVESARRAPIAGHGLGSSQAVMAAGFLESDNIRHPHNDYLRLWHDLGAVGLALLLLSVAVWGWVLARDWRSRRSDSTRLDVVRLTALLTLLELLLSMITDNVLIYPFFMGAAGVVIGAPLGMGPSAPRRRGARRVR